MLCPEASSQPPPFGITWPALPSAPGQIVWPVLFTNVNVADPAPAPRPGPPAAPSPTAAAAPPNRPSTLLRLCGRASRRAAASVMLSNDIAFLLTGYLVPPHVAGSCRGNPAGLSCLVQHGLQLAGAEGGTGRDDGPGTVGDHRVWGAGDVVGLQQTRPGDQRQGDAMAAQVGAGLDPVGVADQHGPLAGSHGRGDRRERGQDRRATAALGPDEAVEDQVGF